MTEKIKCILTCELVEVYLTREEAVESLQGWDHEGEQYIVARTIRDHREYICEVGHDFHQSDYPSRNWAVYQVITVGNEEVI